MNRLSVTTHLAALGLGLTAGWWIYRPVSIAEPPAPEARQSDGSLILRRDAGVKPDLPKIPAGAKPVRHASVTVRPKQPEAAPAGCPVCPDVRVDLTTVEQPDGSRRVVAASPDGTVTGGVDVPIEARSVQTAKKWAGGGYYSPLDNGFGGWVSRDLGPWVIGAQAGVAEKQVDVRAFVGIRF